MKSGIYGCFSLDGAPVGLGDRAALGLDGSDGVAAAPGAVARGMDLADPGAIDVANADGDLCILQGYLDEPEDLAAKLGLPRDASAATLARAAIERFGEAAPAQMIGEWSCALWRSAPRRLTLMVSMAVRDPLLYAIAGGRVAVAPDLRRLTRLDWVDGEIDAEGLLFHLGRQRVRRIIGDRTIARGVKAVENGTCVTIRFGTCRTSAAARFEQAPRWRGSFDDAMTEVEALLRKIMRQRLARRDKAAFLLSGGLDSSTLSLLGSAERRPGQEILLLSSAAPPESGLVDETGFARIVADCLGLNMERVTPAPEPSIYRPSVRQFEAVNGPLTSPRHYLYDAFFDAALRFGASTIVDGAFGEMTVTGRFPLATPRYRAIHFLRRLRDTFRPQQPSERWPDEGFHVRLAPHRYVDMPAALTESWLRPNQMPEWRRLNEAWGYFPGAAKIMLPSTELLCQQLRFDFPFRDARLLKLFSGFPAHFLRHEGFDRAPARALLKGRLPNSIRLRPKGMPFSPDYYDRLRAQAPQALDRIPVFRAAGVEEWLDLDWLAQGLVRVQSRGARDVSEAFQIQLTANVAEFLTWRRDAAL